MQSGPGHFPHPRWERFRSAYHPGMFYGPPRGFGLLRRLFWFGAGAGVYALFNRHDQWHAEHRRYIDGSGSDAATDGQEGRRGHCMSHWGWRRHQPDWNTHTGQPQGWSKTPAQSPPAALPSPSYAPPPPASTPVPATVFTTQPDSHARADVVINADWNTDHIKEAGRNASDAFVDISENALDSLLVSIQAMKSKLAQARAERENEKMRSEQRGRPGPPEPKRLV